MNTITKIAMISFMILILSACNKNDGITPSGEKDLSPAEYIEENNIDAVELEEGVYISYAVKGTGVQPIIDSRVNVKYKGYLTDDTVFDESEEADFLLYQVIRGWQIGLKDMPVGSEAKLIIPSDQAYGKQGSGVIPPHATLIFDVTLLDIIQ